MLLAGCAAGGPIPTPTLPFPTATPPTLPTPRTTPTARPIAPLAPTATAVPAAPTPRAATTPTSAPAGMTPGATATIGQPAAPATFAGESAYRHVEELSISIGTRAAGSEGEAIAADYISDQLASLGYDVERQRFNITIFQDNGSSLTLLAPPATEPRTYQPLAMYYSGAGQVDGPLVLAGWGAPADFLGGVARNKIALVERGGGLTFQDKARNAKAGGALAVIVFNNATGAMQGSLNEPFDLPVVSVTRQDGMRLTRLVQQQPAVQVQLKVNVATELKPSYNVLATAPNPSGRLPIIVVGAHYDTMAAGPGANNNASGVGIMLELARALAREQRADLRFVAFGAKEVGLVGSKAYVENLSPTERNRIVAMINLDMVGVGTVLALHGTEDLVARAMTIANGLNAGRVTRLTGARTTAGDHVSFMEAGIPTLFLHRPDDPNYQSGQDRAQFVKMDALESAGTVSLRLIEQLIDGQMAPG
jgi:aminopeptidase YwaD